MIRLVKLLGHLPLWLHYLIADTVLFPSIYHVVRYRRHMVRKNMQNAFPHKSWKEIKILERRFYRFFADMIVETIYGFSAPKEEITRRVKFHNAELLEKPACATGGLIVMLGHLGNWEWLADYSNQLQDKNIKSYNLYRKLKSKTFDNLMKAIRRQRGGDVLDMKTALRHIIANKQKGEPSIYTFLADQKPSAKALDYWTTFLNQDTPVINGAEQIARKTGFPVIYVHTKRIKRGWYESWLEPISMDPANTEKNEITERYARMLENNIIEDPSIWLWTHNRWKFKRN